MRKNLSVKTGLASLLLLIFLSVEAQNNPYKIDDELYAYYERCYRMVKEPGVMLMADTLFCMAEKKNDVKAQCLAKNLKAEHYYYADNIDSLLTEKERVADFARQTPHKQYIFGAWNRIITYYLRKREYDAAIRELKKYRDEAIRLNVPYGIGQSYVRMGDVYFQQQMTEIALEQYIQAMNYYLSIGKKNELYYPYYSIASCYVNHRKYKEAEEYTLKSLETVPNEISAIGCYLNLFRIYTLTGKYEKAATYRNIILRDKERGMLQTGRLENFYIISARYFLETGDYNQALTYCDSIKDKSLKKNLKSQIYAQTGDYRTAYQYMLDFTAINDSLIRHNNSEALAAHNARFNNQKLELDKNRLMLQNAEMQLKQAQDRERLILMEKERDRIELENRDLQLEQQRTAIELEKAETQKQRLEVMHRQEELNKIEREKAAAKRKGVVIISVLLLITGFSTIYAITRKQHARQLQKEKEVAEAARSRAEKADKLKSSFLQNMSHEIRTPLNAIVGFNDLLNDPSMELDGEERQELLRHLHTNTHLLLTLVNDVLDLSKLESGNYNITLVPTNLSELCRSTLAGVGGRVSEGVELLLKQPPVDTVMTTDQQRLQQILTNLLVNACKYTRQGSITLAYEQKDGKVVFSVTDTGTGIDKEKAEVIFQRFEKLDSFNPGFGLGLSICRSLTHILGGKVYLDTNYTGGARFVVEFPL